MAVTNVSCLWNATTGDLEFRQGEPGTTTGTLLMRLNAMANGVNLQWGTTSVATTNGLNYNANYYLTITDNAGSTRYVGVSNALW